jgi:hypothetical protein
MKSNSTHIEQLSQKYFENEIAALNVENDQLRQAAIAARNTEPKNELGTLHLENCCNQTVKC